MVLSVNISYLDKDYDSLFSCLSHFKGADHFENRCSCLTFAFPSSCCIPNLRAHDWPGLSRVSEYLKFAENGNKAYIYFSAHIFKIYADCYNVHFHALVEDLKNVCISVWYIQILYFNFISQEMSELASYKWE